jgi:hypothetical protein
MTMIRPQRPRLNTDIPCSISRRAQQLSALSAPADGAAHSAPGFAIIHPGSEPRTFP